jgi:hypothetical protein
MMQWLKRKLIDLLLLGWGIAAFLILFVALRTVAPGKEAVALVKAHPIITLLVWFLVTYAGLSAAHRAIDRICAGRSAASERKGR